MKIVLVILSFLPGLLIVWWILRHDLYNHEPPAQLITCFVLGGLATIPVYWIERAAYESGIEDDSGIGYALLHAFVIIALVEEAFKFLCLRGYIYGHPSFDEALDGIVYAAMIGMGFACVENALYAARYDLNTLLVRSFTSVPAHASFAIMMGYFTGKAKFAPITAKKRLLINAVAWPILAHGLYDFCLIQQLYDWLIGFSLPVLGVCAFMAWRLLREFGSQNPMANQA